MSTFLHPDQLIIGKKYRLREIIREIPIGAQEYFLMCKEENFPNNPYPRLGFSLIKDGEPHRYLQEADINGFPTWRHTIKIGTRFQIHCPISALCWTEACVIIEPLPEKE